LFAARKQVRRNVNTTWRSLQPLRHGFADLARDVGKPQPPRAAGSSCRMPSPIPNTSATR
ncbi:hypothetical protein, partial [Paraburkholderia aspalathi]|uniref:hypothetical protein n=1 Tax=Paraburkholderia aspalathi TaxID=1324617 RepID=UPI001BAD4D6F